MPIRIVFWCCWNETDTENIFQGYRIFILWYLGFFSIWLLIQPRLFGVMTVSATMQAVGGDFRFRSLLYIVAIAYL